MTFKVCVNGRMGVPITLLEKYCPEQFDILGLYTDTRNAEGVINGTPVCLKNGAHRAWVGPCIGSEARYARIMIRRRT